MTRQRTHDMRTHRRPGARPARPKSGIGLIVGVAAGVVVVGGLVLWLVSGGTEAKPDSAAARPTRLARERAPTPSPARTSFDTTSGTGVPATSRRDSYEERAGRLGGAVGAGDLRTANRAVTTIADDLRRMRRIVAGLGADMSTGRLASLTNEEIGARSFGDAGLTAAWREARRLALRDPNAAAKRARAGATPLAPEDLAPAPEELVQAGVEKAAAIRKVLREYATGLDASARRLHALTDGQLTAWAGGDADLLSAMWTARSLAQQRLAIKGKYTGPIQSLLPGGKPIHAGAAPKRTGR